MFYTVYKITNNLNGKYYIGKHQTKDLNDGYMGSGKAIKQAIKKYGIENFSKEIIAVYTNIDDMNLVEELLVNISYNSYNLKKGGIGGFDYINENNLGNTEKCKQQKSEKMKSYWSEDHKIKKSNDMIKFYENNGTDNVSLGLKKRYANNTFKTQFTKTMEIVNKSDKKRQDASKTIKEKWKLKDFRDKMKNRKPRGSDGSKLKEKWNDPVWREKMLEARKKKK